MFLAHFAVSPTRFHEADEQAVLALAKTSKHGVVDFIRRFRVCQRKVATTPVSST
jgi:hypothetical protein